MNHHDCKSFQHVGSWSACPPEYRFERLFSLVGMMNFRLAGRLSKIMRTTIAFSAAAVVQSRRACRCLATRLEPGDCLPGRERRAPRHERRWSIHRKRPVKLTITHNFGSPSPFSQGIVATWMPFHNTFTRRGYGHGRLGRTRIGGRHLPRPAFEQSFETIPRRPGARIGGTLPKACQDWAGRSAPAEWTARWSSTSRRYDHGFRRYRVALAHTLSSTDAVFNSPSPPTCSQLPPRRRTVRHKR